MGTQMRDTLARLKSVLQKLLGESDFELNLKRKCTVFIGEYSESVSPKDRTV